MSPPHAIGFFERAGFGDDKEGSVPMRLSLESFQQRCSLSSRLSSETDASLCTAADDVNASPTALLHACRL